ncbi:NAD(P)-binding protein [Actinomadura fulvescens]|uniref:NAD(P)/FAD-dependent oxidoreductase n=1 Tax=Actinomadura fulvescens TaxID=46160 RepID=A0ABN3QWG8_9ACTN
MKRRICIIGTGVSGLGAAWALSRRPGEFDVQVFERDDRIGGNAVTVDFPTLAGGTVPVDISVTAFIPSVYQNYVELMKACGVPQTPTRFSYSVRYGNDVYAHDFDSELRTSLADDIAKFRRLLRFLGVFNELNRRPSVTRAAVNPFDYVSMRRMLDLWGISDDFRYKALKPLFVNFVLASGVFEMPASLFSRYLDFFDVERATPMVTWRGGTRAVYGAMTAGFQDRIHLGRAAVRVVHTDASVLPDDATHALRHRSNFVRRHGPRPDDYEITYIMHNQQPWAATGGLRCLVTYNLRTPIDESKVVGRFRFRHVVHDVFHTAALLALLPLLQGRNRTWFCGAHTLINSQEHGLLSGLAVARRLGADYPFTHNPEATAWFNFHGTVMHGRRFPRCRPAF